jgi:ZIP family zinc transporter
LDLAGVAQIFFFATLTAAATGLGALPFLLARKPARRWLGGANALAAGLMLAASFGLVYEGLAYGGVRTLAGAALGLAFVVASRRFLDRYQHLRLGALGELDSRKVLLIVGVMTLHSFTEGVGVGVSFGGGEALGLFITTAIAVHNIPEGLAISLVLVPRGVSVGLAAFWSVFSSLPQPLMAVPAYVFVESFEPLLPAGLGFAAGAMIWMVFYELVPDALEETSAGVVAAVVKLAVLGMVAFQLAISG